MLEEVPLVSDALALILDCGATNATASVASAAGALIASASRPNAPDFDPGSPGNLVWDVDAILDRLFAAACDALAGVDRSRVKALAVTTFGADGAPVAADGSLLYPVISWQCGRTEPLADSFAELCDPFEAFTITGYQVFSFNTILKLLWLRRHAPQTLDNAAAWLMMPGLLSHRLCGEMSVDATAACTTMAIDLGARGWSDAMLALAGVAQSLFPRWVEPGEVIGALAPSVAADLGLALGIPVVAAGHDTQFAIVGSGAREGEAVLSSGTWEILATRARAPELTREVYESGLMVELDAEPGLTNPQFLMMASGGLEWVRRRFYGDLGDGGAAYETMIAEAAGVPPGSDGLVFLPQFVRGAGPSKRYGTGGGMLGLELHTPRGQVYRAALEGLAFQLRNAMDILGRLQGAPVTSVRAVGGGSRNALWNQIRADVCGVPLVTIEQKEATVLGAAMFAFVGAGVYSSLDEARSAATVERVYEPGIDSPAYAPLYERYALLPPALEGFFR